MRQSRASERAMAERMVISAAAELTMRPLQTAVKKGVAKYIDYVLTVTSTISGPTKCQSKPVKNVFVSCF